MHGGFHAHAVGFGFEGMVLNYGSSASEGIAHASGALLQDVR